LPTSACAPTTSRPPANSTAACSAYQEPFTLNKPNGGGLLLTYFKVNDHQYIEVFPELNDPKQDRLSHISFETTNADQLRAYLGSQGVKVPDQLESRQDGNRGFSVKDPDGHTVEFVEYVEGSLHSRNFGKFLPATPHFPTDYPRGRSGQRPRPRRSLYRDILGFKDIWHGGMKDDRTDWVDMRVPDGTDWLEYMLTSTIPTQSCWA